MSTGSRGKTVSDDRNPCIGLGLPPHAPSFLIKSKNSSRSNDMYYQFLRVIGKIRRLEIVTLFLSNRRQQYCNCEQKWKWHRSEGRHFGVLSFAKSLSVITVQREFWRKYRRNAPTSKSIRRDGINSFRKMDACVKAKVQGNQRERKNIRAPCKVSFWSPSPNTYLASVKLLGPLESSPLELRAEKIDDVIRAELPDQEGDPELFYVVKTQLVHGPCVSYNLRSPCMKHGICSKRFSKPFSTEVVTDLVVFDVQNASNEVTSYQKGRYISTSEDIWRILSFSIHERFPAVTHLDIHLENGQRIHFDPSNVRGMVENPRSTTLMAFFELCHNDEFAASLLYEEIPDFITHLINKMVHSNDECRDTSMEGHPCIFHEQILGRIYTIHPNNREYYHLRMLLNPVKGPTSFESLKSVNGILYPTYQAACLALGLLEGHNH
ncbi:helitron_like_N domain-containing protein [Trichonephila clavipes]|nr:helitron_like_N domain-containing protein [Trichonephila clavipes]